MKLKANRMATICQRTQVGRCKEFALGDAAEDGALMLAVGAVGRVRSGCHWDRADKRRIHRDSARPRCTPEHSQTLRRPSATSHTTPGGYLQVAISANFLDRKVAVDRSGPPAGDTRTIQRDDSIPARAATRP